jgi:universal stress protein E
MSHSLQRRELPDMRAIRRILVAVKDPAGAAPAAVAKAGQLARALGARVELFHALTAPLMIDAYTSLSGALTEIENAAAERATERLEKMAVPLRRAGTQVTTAVEWDYPAHEAVLRRADRIRADLIVSERHAGSHVFPGVLQLTDWELLRLSRVPVLLVKTAGVYRKPVILAALDPGRSYSKPASLDARILRTSQLFARQLHGTLHAIHAYVPISEPILETGLLDEGTIAEVESDAVAKATSRFERALRNQAIPARRRHLVPQHPIEAIDATAREIGSAIVVMGAVSRSGLKRFVIGNTAETLLDRLDCDLLIVKPYGFAARVPNSPRGVHLVSLASVAGV